MFDFKGKKVLIAGLGKSGMASLDILLPFGASVFVYDAKDAASFDSDFLKKLDEKNVGRYLGVKPSGEDRFDALILSPGISPNASFVRDAAKNGTEIIGELELAFRLCKGSFAAITGTNGKTTTTALVGEIFKNAERDAYVVGNIGTAVTTVCRKTRDDTWLITETSSFQLETIKRFRPKISAVLNITPDHLDRHKSMENYLDAKARIFENQTESDYFVFNADDGLVREMSTRCKAKVVPFSRVSKLAFGAFVNGQKITIADESGKLIELCDVSELRIAGSHNLENALAAAAIAYFAGIPASVITKTLASFSGVPHRLELCGEINGVRFINDSKGTNPDASIKALEATAGPILLIAGGYDKKSDFGAFIEAFDGKVKKMLLLGATAEHIKECAERKGFHESVLLRDMEACVCEAFRRAERGDTVLLSPACASWDMYTCFEERGDDFKACVKRLGN